MSCIQRSGGSLKLVFLYEEIYELSPYILTVRAIDENGKGIPNVEVYLFEELSPQDPSLARYKEVTDTSGEAKFDVSGVFGVGLIAKGYEATDPAQIPPAAWRAVWTAWGAVGVARNIDYTFTFRKIYVPSWWERRSTGEKALVVVVPIGLVTLGLIALARRK